MNARPLLGDWRDRCVLDEPAALAGRFAEGRLDAALLPVPAVLGMRHPIVVRDVGIGCRGAVHSVVLAHPEPLENTREVAPDPGSQSSRLLLECLLREYHGFGPEYSPQARARLLIGDRAIAFRKNLPGGWHLTDLGEEWHHRTGLPFVFAVWVMRPGFAQAEATADFLRATRDSELAAIQNEPEDAEHAFLKKYYTEHLRFSVGADELAGLRRFARMAVGHGLLESACPDDWRFI